MRMEHAFDSDFSQVRVHTSIESDNLNRELSSRAFATGADVFFAEGEYNPGTSSGRELLAHELTHVVQQGGASLRAKLSVGSATDPAETAAEEVSRAFVRRETSPAENDEDDTVQQRLQME
jgi:hypothetical protein